MLVEPAIADFARAYDAGEPQVVWTRLVADLETPVSAMLKLSAGPRRLLPSGVGRGRRRARPLLDHRHRAGPDLPRHRRQGRDQRRSEGAPRPLPSRWPSRRWTRSAASSPKSRIRLPAGLPPMAAGVFGYLGYDMVRQMEELGAPNPDPLGLPDAILFRPTTIVIFDAVKDEITIVSPVRPATRRQGRPGPRPRRRPADGGGRRPRHAARQVRRRRRVRPDIAGRLQHAARALSRHGAAGEGLHRRRRHLPGGAVAALRGAVRPAAVRALPGAPPHQPVAVSSTTSTSAASRLPDRARRSWSASATAR